MSGKVVREQDTFGSSVTKTPSRREEGPSSPPSVDPEDRSCVRAIRFSIPGGRESNIREVLCKHTFDKNIFYCYLMEQQKLLYCHYIFLSLCWAWAMMLY